MTYNTSGLTLGVLISPALLIFRRLLTPCSTGIKMRRNATYTSRTYRHLAKTETFSQARAYGKRLSGIASCLLEAGCFNNILALLYVERSSVVKSIKNYNNNKALHYCVRLSQNRNTFPHPTKPIQASSYCSSSFDFRSNPILQYPNCPLYRALLNLDSDSFIPQSEIPPPYSTTFLPHIRINSNYPVDLQQKISLPSCSYHRI